MSKSLNKGISTSLGILIILIAAILAGGIVIYKYQRIPEGEVKLPEIKVPEEETKDETANWKTYSNEKYGYEVKYPPHYEIKESDQGKSLNIGTPVMPYYSISITENISSLEELKASWQNSVDELLARFPTPPAVEVTWKDTVISGKKAIEMSYEQFIGGYTGITRSTSVIKDSTAYRIGLENGSEEEYYKILSTFRFIETDETAD